TNSGRSSGKRRPMSGPGGEIRTRHAASLDPSVLGAWIFVMRVFHSLIVSAPTRPPPFLFSTDGRCQCTTTYVNVTATPVDLNPGAHRAVLLFHGFPGTPHEVRGVGASLAARGLRAVGPMLPGHGRDVAALNATTARDWLDAAARAFDAVRPVAVVGMSMG